MTAPRGVEKSAGALASPMPAAAPPPPVPGKPPSPSRRSLRPDLPAKGHARRAAAARARVAGGHAGSACCWAWLNRGPPRGPAPPARGSPAAWNRSAREGSGSRESGGRHPRVAGAGHAAPWGRTPRGGGRRRPLPLGGLFGGVRWRSGASRTRVPLRGGFRLGGGLFLRLRLGGGRSGGSTPLGAAADRRAAAVRPRRQPAPPRPSSRTRDRARRPRHSPHRGGTTRLTRGGGHEVRGLHRCLVFSGKWRGPVARPPPGGVARLGPTRRRIHGS